MAAVSRVACAGPVDIELGKGVGYMMVSIVAFTLMNALAKLALEHYPFGQLVFLRSGIALLPLLGILAWQGNWAVLRQGPAGTLFWLSALVVGSMLAGFWSYHLLPFADATFYSFIGPLIITALSAPMLGERIGRRRWAAVLLGFGGVVLITPPGQGLLGMGVLVALLSATLYSVGMVLTRRSSSLVHPTAVVFYFTLLATVVGALWLPWGWMWPDAWGWAVMGGAGLAGCVGQYAQTQAFRMAPPSICGALSYSRIVLAVIIGYLVWWEVPTAITLLGSAIVVACGLYLIFHESRSRAR